MIFEIAGWRVDRLMRWMIEDDDDVDVRTNAESSSRGKNSNIKRRWKSGQSPSSSSSIFQNSNLNPYTNFNTITIAIPISPSIHPTLSSKCNSPRSSLSFSPPPPSQCPQNPCVEPKQQPVSITYPFPISHLLPPLPPLPHKLTQPSNQHPSKRNTIRSTSTRLQTSRMRNSSSRWNLYS